MKNEDEIDLGTCCACGCTESVRNVLMLEKKAPVPGTGWGCIVCGIPADGAVAVLCDTCMASGLEIKKAIHGYPTEKKRCNLRTLTEEFSHDSERHKNLEKRLFGNAYR